MALGGFWWVLNTKKRKITSIMSKEIADNVISKICIPWLQNPYQHPVTGAEINPGSPEHKKLTKLCSDVINFDLLELINDSNESHSVSVSPIVSFLSAAFISKYAAKQIYHPYQKEYTAQTTAESNILDNFDFGFVWYKPKRGEGKWKLEPPKGKNKLDRHIKGVQMVLVSIIGDIDVTVNILFYDSKAHSWERFTPLGAREYDTQLDQALMDYLSESYKTVTRGITSYYTPVSCPIATMELEDLQRQLYCSLWSLWFLLYRIKNNGVSRETQYSKAIGEALENSSKFNQFIVDYISFINQHKARIIGAGQRLLCDQLNNDIDNFLAEQIFSLF